MPACGFGRMVAALIYASRASAAKEEFEPNMGMRLYVPGCAVSICPPDALPLRCPTGPNGCHVVGGETSINNPALNHAGCARARSATLTAESGKLGT